MCKTSVALNLSNFEAYFDKYLIPANGFVVFKKEITPHVQVLWRGYVDSKYALMLSVTKVNEKFNLKISLALYEIQETQADCVELYMSLLQVGEDMFYPNAKVGLEDRLVVFGFNFIFPMVELDHVRSILNNLNLIAEEHLSEIALKYQLEPVVTTYKIQIHESN